MRVSKQDALLLAVAAGTLAAGYVALRYALPLLAGVVAPKPSSASSTGAALEVSATAASAAAASSDAAFHDACEQAKTLSVRDNSVLLRLYALFKQGTAGDAPEQSTLSFMLLNPVAAAKHDAWAHVRGMSPSEARAAYITLVAQLQSRDDSSSVGMTPPGSERRGGGWVATSRPLQDEEDEDDDLWSRVHACASSDDAPALTAHLRASGVHVDAVNDAGETMLHVAADRGACACTRALLDLHARPCVRTRDAEGGQTALHYACAASTSAGDAGEQIALMLVAAGACVDVADADGTLPIAADAGGSAAELRSRLLAARSSSASASTCTHAATASDAE